MNWLNRIFTPQDEQHLYVRIPTTLARRVSKAARAESIPVDEWIWRAIDDQMVADDAASLDEEDA